MKKNLAKYREVKDFGTWGLVLAGSAFLINYLLTEATTLTPRIIYFVVVVYSTIAGFYLNKSKIFKDPENSLPISSKMFTKYVVVVILTRFSEYLCYQMLIMLNIYYLCAQAMSLGTMFLLKFFLYKKIFTKPTKLIKN